MKQFLLTLLLLLFCTSLVSRVNAKTDGPKDHPPVTAAKLSIRPSGIRTNPKPVFYKINGPRKNYLITETALGKGLAIDRPHSLSGIGPLPKYRVFSRLKSAGPDPIRFVMQANKTSVAVGEEFEITITAELLPILPSQMFFFDEQRSFSLKVLMPDGFEQTGGDYYDYIGTDLQTGGPALATYTLRGKLTKSLDTIAFTLLRGPKDGASTSYFEKKRVLVLNTETRQFDTNSQARQPATTDTTCQQLLNKPVKIKIQQATGKPTSITVNVKDALPQYEYSADSLNFSKGNVVKTNKTSGFIFIRDARNTKCYRKIAYKATTVAVIGGPKLPAKGNTANTTLANSDCEVADFITLTADSYEVCPSSANAAPKSDKTNPQSSQARVAASSSVLLTVSGCSSDISWYRNGYLISGGNSNQLSVSSGGTYYVQCRTNECPDVFDSSNGVGISENCPPDPCATNPCACQSSLPNYQWDGQLTWCENGNKYKRLQDVNPCSSSHGLYATGDLLEANTCECKSQYDIWEWLGETTCDGTTKRKLYRNTNECSPNYNVTAPGEVLEYNSCECRGTGQQPVVQDEVCDGVNKVRRYRDANECSPTFNQVISTEVLAANSCECRGTGQQPEVQDEVCDGVNKVRRYRDANECSPTFNQIISTEVLAANSCECRGTGQQPVVQDEVCDGVNKVRRYRDANECSPTFNQIISTEVIAANSCECRGTGQQPVVQDEVCDGVNKVRRYRDANECSPTFNQIISTEVIAANSCECRGTGQQPVVQDEVCDGVNKVRRYRDANECSPTFNQVISTEVIAANSCECRGTGQQPVVQDEVCDGVNKVRRYRDANECSPTFNQIISTEVIAANSCECRGTGQQPVVQDEVCDGVNKVRRYRDANECSPTFNQIISTEVIAANSCECQGQQPPASINGNLNICSGQSTILTASAGSTYLWSTGATTASINTAQAGLYSVTINNGAGCLATASTTVTETTLSESPTLTARVAGVSTTQSITLTASGCSAGQVVRWNGPGNTSATGSVWILPLTQNSTYSAHCEAGNGCSGVAATISATYTTLNAPIIQTSATLLCAGDSVTLSAAGCPVGTTVQWSSGNTGQTIRLAPNATANYTAVCAQGEVVSDASNQLRITVSNSLSVTGRTTYNIGETISLTAFSSAPGSVTYTWSGPAGFTQAGAILQRLGASSAQSGSYTVVAHAPTGCAGRQVVPITVGGSTNVITTQAVSVSAVCAGATLSVPFSTTGTFTPGNVFTVQLSDATGSFATFTTLGSGTSSPIGVVIPSATASGNYQLRVVSDYPITEGSSTPLTISGVPSLSASSNSPSGQVLLGNPLSLSASDASTPGQNLAGASYAWSGPNNAFTITVNTPTLTLPHTSTASNGMYTVVATTPGGCTATAQTSVSLGAACGMSYDGEPIVGCDSTIADSTHWGKLTVKLLNQPAGSSLRISLYQQTTLVATLTSTPASFTGLAEGSYRVDAYALTGSDTCRAGARTLTVRCASGPLNIRIKAVDATPAETDLIPRVGGGLGSLHLSVEELDGQDLSGYSYLWGEPTSTSATTSTATSTTLTARRIGEYKVTLTNGLDTLFAYTTLRTKPCRQVAHSYLCGTTPAAPILDAGSVALSSLAPGDTIRTGDFDVIVTQVLGGGSGTWTGTGYTLIPYLGDNKIAVDFTDAGINDCYEYTGGGTVQSAYNGSFFAKDGNLGGAVNIQTLVAEIITLLDNLKPADSSMITDQKQRLNSLITSIQGDTTLTNSQKQAAIEQLNKIEQQLTLVEQQPCLCAPCSTTNAPGGRRASGPNCPNIQEEIIKDEVSYTEALGGSYPGCNAPKPTGAGRDGELKITQGFISHSKAGNIPCTKTWVYVKKIGDIAVNEGWYENIEVVIDSLYQYGEVNPISQLLLGNKPKLTRFSQWYIQDRVDCQQAGLCNNTFGKAAYFNTRQSNYKFYKPIAQINAYYNWAAKEVEKNSPVRFFHAARDVTGWYGVRGAFLNLDGTVPSGLSEAGRKSLADVNIILIEKNMPIINQILTTGSSNAVAGTGIIWDFNYVLSEQTALTQYLKQNNYLTKRDIEQINNNFDTYELLNFHFKLAKLLVNAARLDYQIEKHRFAIGRSLVFLRHADDPTFVNSPRYQQALDYLKAEYGNQNVERFRQAFLAR